MENEINAKAYQVVQRANGTYDVRRYNGAKAEQRYTTLGHFVLFNLMTDEQRKINRKVEAIELGNTTCRRNASDVITQAVESARAMIAMYIFRACAGVTLSDSEKQLIEQHKQRINDAYKLAQCRAYIEILDALSDIRFRDLNDGNLEDNAINKLADKMYIMHNDVSYFCEHSGSKENIESRMQLMHPDVFHEQ